MSVLFDAGTLLRVPLLCCVGEAWCYFVQSSAKIKSRFKYGFLACLGPEIKMIARNSALEAAKHVSSEVSRKGTVFSSVGRLMKRALAPHLIASSFDDDNSEQLQYLGHSHVGSELPKVNGWHGPPTGTEKRNPYDLVLHPDLLNDNTLNSDEPVFCVGQKSSRAPKNLVDSNAKMSFASLRLGVRCSLPRAWRRTKETKACRRPNSFFSPSLSRSTLL